MSPPIPSQSDDRAGHRDQAGRNGPDLELTEAERHALIQELFAFWRAEGNQGTNCFCGSDADLIRAVTQARADAARQRQRATGRTDARTSAPGNASTPPGRGGRGELAERVAHLAQASPSQAPAQSSADGLDPDRREQLLRWHDDDDRAAADRLAAHGGVAGDDLDGDG